MATVPSQGIPAPQTGELPAFAYRDLPGRGLGLYIHVPFCATRCGYCDFNTYTAAELGAEPGSSQDAYLAAVYAELELAASVLGPRRPDVSTIFFGGGTPTLLPAAALVGILDQARRWFDFDPECEITTEANPESVDPAYLDRLRVGGFTRLSFGMQSSVEHVLQVLERRHSPGRALDAVGWGRAAGFDSISLDLIFGAPGESVPDWETTVRTAIQADPDHISAYSLIVEQGTRLAKQVASGAVPAPDEDDLADKYTIADELLSEAGLAWYEVSNWAKPGHACRHNLAYWRSGNWWGIGPGAHSHIGGVRWWNVPHPRRYTSASQIGSPAQARELLTEEEKTQERIMLEVRLATGLDPSVLTPRSRAKLPSMVADGLVASIDPVVLTLRGRLLADLVIRELT